MTPRYGSMSNIAKQAKAILPTGALLLSGCASFGSTHDAISAYRSNIEKINMDAVNEYNAGEFISASNKWKSIAQHLSSASELNYFEGGLYLDELRAEYSAAWSILEAGEAEGGKDYYDLLAHEVTNLMERRTAFLDKREGELASRNLANRLILDAFTSTLSPEKKRIIDAIFTANPMPEPAFDIKERSPAALQDNALESTPFRVVTMPTLEPLINIGQFVRPEGTCTASLVGPKLALTNAHCVTEKSKTGTNWSPAKGSATEGMRLVFETPLHAPDIVNITDYETHAGKNWNGSISTDWAILHLDRHPVERGYLGWIEDTDSIHGHNKNTSVMVAGHSGDLNDGRYITMDYNCAASAKDMLMYYRCETAPGSSGAPIFLTDGQYRHHYLIGIHNRSDRSGRSGGGIRSEAFSSALKSALEKQNANI